MNQKYNRILTTVQYLGGVQYLAIYPTASVWQAFCSTLAAPSLAASYSMWSAYGRFRNFYFMQHIFPTNVIHD